MHLGVPLEYDFAYSPGNVVFGRNCVERLGPKLDEMDAARVLVVCGTTVGSTPDVMDPIRSALGDRLAGVFDETTPVKTGETVRDGVAVIDEVAPDAVLAVGGGSFMDIARVMVAMAAEGGPIESLDATIAPDGTVSIPDLSAPKPPVLAVPTTMAGAELGCATGANFADAFQDLEPGTRVGPIYDDQLVPRVICYDPALVETTPKDVLIASAMNGIDHGIEMLYSRNGNPLTDAVAHHGVALLADALPSLVDAENDDEALGRALNGLVCASYGLIDPFGDGDKFSLIHGFGHAIAARGVQQGAAHAVVAPDVLAFVFENVDGNRDLLASALDVTGDDPDATAEAVVAAEEDLRARLGLPTALRDLPEIKEEDLPEIAAEVSVDIGIPNGPAGLDPSEDELRAILDAAW